MMISNDGGGTPFARIAAFAAEQSAKLAQICQLKLPPLLPILPDALFPSPRCTKRLGEALGVKVLSPSPLQTCTVYDLCVGT